MPVTHVKVLTKVDPVDTSVVGTSDWNNDHNFTSPIILEDADKNPISAICWGTGSPEGIITNNKGSLYLRTDGGAGTTLYVKESGTGNTGWVAK